jgi:hypothetical protein
MRTALALVLSAAAVAATASTAAPPASLRLVAAVDLEGAPTSMVTADGDVWAALGVQGVVRIDPESTRSSDGSTDPFSRLPRDSGPSGDSTSSRTSWSASTR